MDAKGKGKAREDAVVDEVAGAQEGQSKGGASAAGAAPGSHLEQPSPPSVCIITIGMAGSGKTTFVHRLTSYLHSVKKPPYILNLDPAVMNLGYEANIDIRDTVDYKEVMKQYNLGPNGGILTALNLFTTKFDQVLGFVDKKAQAGDTPYVILDTPGQIEIFTWSASGSIITDAMASSMPTVVAYIIDTPRTAAPETFMSNMLYACSILYKTKLPFILVFNKTDVKDWGFAQEWMNDFEAFQDALMRKKKKGENGDEDGDGEDGGFMTSLMSSMSLMLEEFYRNLRACGVSAMTGDGMEDFFAKVEEARQEYEDVYKPELLKVQQDRQKAKESQKADNMARLMKDMKVSQDVNAAKRGGSGGMKSSQKKTPRTKEEIMADLEEQEQREELEEAEKGYEEGSEEEEIIDRADHDMYQDLRREHQRRAGVPDGAPRRRPAVEDDAMGGRWPAP